MYIWLYIYRRVTCAVVTGGGRHEGSVREGEIDARGEGESARGKSRVL